MKRMMRMLLMMAIVLTANVVSAQEFFDLPAAGKERPRTYAEDRVEATTINFPYCELTQIRLWAPQKTGEYRWWKLMREHRGPGWKQAGGFFRQVDDVVIDIWYPEEPAQEAKADERQPIRHSTIDVWKLRDEELKKMEAREPRPTRLTEPVFQIPTNPSQVEEPREDEAQRTSPPQKQAPTMRDPATEKKPTPTQPRRFRPSGPSVLVLNGSSGN